MKGKGDIADSARGWQGVMGRFRYVHGSVMGALGLYHTTTRNGRTLSFSISFAGLICYCGVGERYSHETRKDMDPQTDHVNSKIYEVQYSTIVQGFEEYAPHDVRMMTAAAQTFASRLK